ncbi:MAG: VWA domain-containing protein [Nitrospinota bacterium]|nr:VWA domain-containing protein [Nitrospinota bacterium]
MRFADPAWMYAAMVALPLLGLLGWWGIVSGRRALERLFSPEAAQRLAPARLTAKKTARAIILSLAIILLLLAMARPQYGIKPMEAKRSGIDIMLLVDTSTSMLAADVKPNRMARAKNELSRLVSALDGNRIGIIAFAGESFVECPLTLDSATVRLFLDTIAVGIIPTPGTAIGQAVEEATAMLSRSGSSKAKAIILVTDGEDLAGEVEQAAQTAKKAGVNIHAVGIGSNSGAPIPDVNEFGEVKGYKYNNNGAPLLTRLDATSLTTLASATGGVFIASQGEALDLSGLVKAIQKQEKTDIGSLEFTEYEERYQPLALMALLLLLGEYLFSAWAAGRKSLA